MRRACRLTARRSTAGTAWGGRGVLVATEDGTRAGDAMSTSTIVMVRRPMPLRWSERCRQSTPTAIISVLAPTSPLGWLISRTRSALAHWPGAGQQSSARTYAPRQTPWCSTRNRGQRRSRSASVIRAGPRGGPDVQPAIAADEAAKICSEPRGSAGLRAPVYHRPATTASPLEWQAVGPTIDGSSSDR